MFSLDEDDEGEVSFGESSDAEREMTPDIPKAPSVRSFDDAGDFEGASEVDSDTLRAFVAAVIYANAAVLLVALGPMVWYFEGWSRIGPALLVAGLLAGIRTYQTYRAWDRAREAKEADLDGEADESPLDGEADESPLDGEADESPLDGEADESPLDGEADESDPNPDAQSPEA